MREHRDSTESSKTVEKSNFALAGAGFHPEQIFTGRGLPKGSPFFYQVLSGK
jgi:hypothetical protein